ncbi:MAG: putative monovalent cation/H+ antiporter subunit A [Syntrophobacteraceae bacterium]
MLLAVLAGFAVGLLAPLTVRAGRGWSGWLIALLPLSLFGYFAHFLPRIEHGERFLFQYGGLSSLGVDLTFCLDGLSLLFALLITGVGTIVCVYSGEYLSGHRDLGKFYSCLLAFMASMLGVVLSDNVIALFMFWELTSITSYLLIGFEHHREPARRAALQALLVTGFGGLSLLAAFLLMQQVSGTFETSSMLEGAGILTGSPLYTAILLLVLVGAATKSAQVPFHFWLPSAMEAPTPVSTYLHAATMVKAGVYLLARFTPLLGGTDLWQNLVMALGALTMVTGAWLSFFQTDLKRILAYATIGALGVCVFLIGIGSASALLACMGFLVAHAVYKGGLFLTAGILDHETGTRNVGHLGGLGGSMPITCTGALLAALSSAGVPPLLGFQGKELLFEATLRAPFPGLLTSLAVFVVILSAAMSGIVGVRPFFGRRANLPSPSHDPSPVLWIGPMILGALGLLLGLVPFSLSTALLAPAASAAMGKAVAAQPFQWHGLDWKLSLSLTGLLAGIILFWKWDRLRSALSGLIPAGRFGPAALYDVSIRALEACARAQTRFFQSGHLHIYLLTVVATATGLLVWALMRDGVALGDLQFHRWTNARLYEVIITLTLLVATFMVATASSRLVAIVCLGVVGYGVALIFLFFSAPDLAMTQFAIETLSVILLVLVMFKLPKYQRFSGGRSRARDAVLALSAGGVMTLLVLIVTSIDRSPRLVPFFADHSLLLAKGRNVVNVILVDFRGFDTLGEITVLSAAAIGVYSLVRFRSRAKNDAEGNE